MSYFPFMVDLEGKRVLVAGGGEIACRKIRVMIDFGAQIRVAAKALSPEIQALAKENPGIALAQKEIEPSDLAGADFVIAATDSAALNREIAVWCRQKKIMVNAVDQKEDSDFIFPAVMRKEDVLVAVSTGGSSPAAAAYLKEQIALDIPEYFGALTRALGSYRAQILSLVPEQKKRSEIFRRLLLYGTRHSGEIPPEVVRELLEEYQT